MQSLWSGVVRGGVCVDVMYTLTHVFGCLLLLTVVASGFLMMFAPAQAKQLLKNAAFALGLFLLASVLLKSWCAR